MLKINQNQINEVVVTLNELKTISNPFYIWSIENDLNLTNKIFYSPDQSTNLSRYNLFNIELVNNIIDEDLLLGKLFIEDNEYGFWTYKIYQSPTINLGLTGLTNSDIVEYGRIYFDLTGNTFTQKYTPNTNRKNYK
jgi:hypothetical protein